jgi:hypothetical protein
MVTGLPAGLIPGDVAVLAGGCDGPGGLAPIFPEGLLLCDSAGGWRSGDVNGSCDNATCLPEETEAIKRLGTEAAGYSRDLQWEGLLAVGVVDPGWETDLERHPLEVAIKTCLPYLRNVFNRPIRHLKVESEAVITSKARRLATTAPEYLAAHPEDWDGRTVLGVKPKRVLANVRQEQWDIYENRLAARLVDHLCLFLSRRIRRLREIQRMLAAATDFSRQIRGSHWLQKRIAALWGSTLRAPGRLQAAGALADELLRLRTQLLGLMDTELYERVPRRARIRGSVRMTNILLNDPNYRFVALLWQKWFETAAELTQSEEEFQACMRLVHTRHADVTVLLLANALVQLGFTEVETNADLTQARSEAILCRQFAPRMKIAVTVGRDRSLILATNGVAVLRFVPVFYGFMDAASDKEALKSLDALPAQAQLKVPTVVVYPGSLASDRSSLSRALQKRLVFRAHSMLSEGASVHLVPVSPYDIASVERLARCVRWYLWSRLFLVYPHLLSDAVVRTIADIIPTPTTLLFRMRGKDSCLRHFATAESSSRALEVAASKMRAEHTHIESEIEGIRQGAKNQASQKEKKRLRALREEALQLRGKLERLDQALPPFRHAVDSVKDLSVCPVCANSSADTRNIDLRENDTFEVQCASCKSRWGLRSCGACGNRYPFILIGGIEKCVSDRGVPGWEESTVGQDMLATPSIVGDGGIATECSWCGQV